MTYFQTKQAHNFSLKKELFLRKITVFEKTVSVITNVHTSISNMASLVKTNLNENVSFSQEDGKQIFDGLKENISQIYRVYYDTANSVELYVDLGQDEKGVRDVQQFWELLGTINLANEQINNGYKLLENVASDDEYQKIKFAIDLHWKELENKVEELVVFSRSVRDNYIKITSLLQEELKKF